MNDKYQKYLPIGSIVLLENASRKLMIIGFAIKSNDDNEIFDYSACVYPEGLLTVNSVAVFNHNQIKTVCSVGYIDEEGKTFHNELNQVMSKKDSTIDSSSSFEIKEL